MAEFTAKDVKELRERTGAGMMDCKKALGECDGDMEKAAQYLREKGIAQAAKRQGRVAAEGAVVSYIHMNGKYGVLAEINCETDFAARSDVFRELCKDLCLQICSANPQWVQREDVPQDAIAAETLRSVYSDREVVCVNVSAVEVGGGGIHCITQQIPEGRFADPR